MSRRKSPSAPTKTLRRALAINNKTDQELSVDDVVEIWWDVANAKREPRFPTLSVCTGCGGFRSLYVAGREVKNPMLAFHIALIEYGRTSINHYDNGAPKKACDCEVALAALKAKLPKIIFDSGWTNAGTGIPSRGINDFTREIEFDESFDAPSQLEIVVDWLERDKCPGWTGVRWRILVDGPRRRYRFDTTWDSSD